MLSDAASPLTYSTDGEGAWGDGEAQEESVTRTASSSHIRVEGTGRDMQLVWQEGGTVEHGPLAAEVRCVGERRGGQGSVEVDRTAA